MQVRQPCKTSISNNVSVKFALAFTATALAVFSQLAPAESGKRHFNIPAQPLNQALMAFGKQGHLQLLYGTDLAEIHNSSALNGDYTPETGLAMLLTGTSLRAVATGADTYTLSPSAADSPFMTVAQTEDNSTADGEGLMMPKVMVEANSDNPYDDPSWTNDPHNTDYNRPNATTATKTDTPIMETPVNIQVLPQQVLKDQQTTRIEQALQNTSGVYKEQAVATESFNLRGFQTFDYYRDGIRNQSALTQAGSRETANLERIEVLKGPAAILFGRIQPGGLINLVTKKPLDYQYLSLQQQFGSFNQYRTTLDTTGPITRNKNLLYRFNLAYEDKGSFREFVNNDRIFIAPVLHWNISDRTQANFEMEYKHVKETPDFGIPAVGNRPANIPRERNLGEPFAYSKSDDILLGMNWSHQFNDQWKISHKFNSTFTDQNEDVVIGLDGLAPNSTEFQRFYSGFRDNKTQTYANNLDLTGHIDTFGIKHTLLFGGDYYIFHNTALLIDNFNFPSIDVNHPVHSGTPTKEPAEDFHFKVDEQWYGLYFQDQVQLPYNVHLLAGFRYDNARFTNPGGLHKDDAINPRVGLLWQPIKEISLYGNYVQNFGVPNIQFGTGGANLSPQSAQQWEAGIKTELFNGRLTGTLAWYQLTKQNIPSLHRSLAGAQNNEFDLTGEAVNEGVELDIAGEILPGWNVIGSYSHIDSKITSDSGRIFNLNGDLVGVGPDNTGNHLPNVPEHGGSLWSTYQIQAGALQGLKVGAGIVARSQRQGNRENNFQLPGYALFNLMAGYEFKVGKTKLTTQLNVNNLLDKNYWPSTDVFSKGQIDVGSPRTFIGSVRVDF